MATEGGRIFQPNQVNQGWASAELPKGGVNNQVTKETKVLGHGHRLIKVGGWVISNLKISNFRSEGTKGDNPELGNFQSRRLYSSGVFL